MSGKKRVIKVKVKKEPQDDVIFYIDSNLSKSVESGRKISELIKATNASRTKEPLPLIRPITRPNYIAYMEYLDIYENNQSFYEKDIDKLIELEEWFCSIREPKHDSSDDEWNLRESNRIKYGISDYCRPDIRKILFSKKKCQH